LHLSVEINGYMIEGLVDNGASMSIMAAAVVREMGMMHLVFGSETYKTASGIVTQAMGRINEVSIKTGGVQCLMTFMVVDTDCYDVLLVLDFLIKIGAIVDVERGLIQVRHGLGADVEVLPLTMVNMLQALNPEGSKPMDLQAARKFDLVVERPFINTEVRNQRPEVRMSNSDSDASKNSEEEHQLHEPICDGSEFETHNLNSWS
jgi:hypothetical protein